MKFIAALFTTSMFITILTGCSSLSTQFKQAYEPPVEHDHAKLRIIANSMVKAIPESSCINWRSDKAGTVFGGMFGSKGYRGRSLNMPLPPDSVRKSEMGELYVAANKPITLVFMTTPESRYQCQISGSFVPDKDKNYEARLTLEPAKRKCFFVLYELDNQRIPITIAPVTGC